ncbi:MAG TPA: hypothetical protein PLU99_15440, partial [Phycisphaerae bacterium]|nr:hypothetical protein [Phycisphaerae bacterium]
RGAHLLIPAAACSGCKNSGNFAGVERRFMRSTCGIAHLRAARPGLVAVYAAVLALAWLPAVARAQA